MCGFCNVCVCVWVWMGVWMGFVMCVYGYVDGFCNVWVCVCMGMWMDFVMCEYLNNVYTLNLFGYPD
jgi:hypothetical protein